MAPDRSCFPAANGYSPAALSPLIRTASMIPDAFFRRAVRFVGGVRVTDPDALLDTLAEGGSGYHYFGRSAEKVLLQADA